MYQVKAEIPSVEEYIEIRLAAGLSRKSKEAAEVALPNSIYGVTVYCGGEKVGIARIISDGGCFFEITDMAVLPGHQSKGVGRMIMEHLVDWLQGNAPKTAYISLMADHGTPDFYEKFGFKKAEIPKSLECQCAFYKQNKHRHVTRFTRACCERYGKSIDGP